MIPPQRPSKALVLSLPLLVLAGWIAAVTLHASVTVDGVRHYYLDDGQMVSMRYARNLAEGRGLVWNPGERVEGYSSPAWVLVMAAVHVAGAPPASASLFVKLIAALCAAGVLGGALALRRELGGSTVAGESILLFSLAMTADVVYWAANGFETALLTAVFTWLLVRIVREDGRPHASTYLAAGILPLIRSDAHLLAAAVVIVGVGLARDRREALRRALLATVLPALHVVFRLVYYGDPLPNTFYLRYAGEPGVWWDGLRYLRAFGLKYGVLAGFAAVTALVSRDRRRMWCLAPVAATGLHALLAGGDAYEHFRFFAPSVPVVIVLGVAGVESWAGGLRARRAAGLAVLLAAAIAAGGMVRPWVVDAMRSWRGKPWQGVVIASLLDRHSAPDASVAAADAGALGYFSMRRVIDLTGRTDPTVARGPGRPGADPGARKFDIERSLATGPDFVVTAGPLDADRLGDVMFALAGVDIERDIGPALLASRTFRRDYRDTPVPIPRLLERRAVYVHRRSEERQRLGEWRLPAAEL